MTFIMQAPHPAISVSTYLPNPELGDSIAATVSLEFKRAINGTKYSYVKSRGGRKKLLWNFIISQDKALELREFFDKHNGDEIKIFDHIGKVYIGNFTSNPFEFEAIGRAVASPSNNTLHQIQIEFEGFEQTP